MLTISGTLVLPSNTNAPSLYDIGWGLARTGRFVGAAKKWYSVLPHTYSVANIVSSEARIHALLHDAAESVVGDQPSTWKNHITEDDEIILLERIYHRLGLDFQDYLDFHLEVHAADIACRAAEARAIGHSDPTLFDIPDRDLYNRAVVYTTTHMEMFKPMRCILDTDTVAKEFEQIVTKELEVIHALNS